MNKLAGAVAAVRWLNFNLVDLKFCWLNGGQNGKFLDWSLSQAEIFSRGDFTKVTIFSTATDKRHTN